MQICLVLEFGWGREAELQLGRMDRTGRIMGRFWIWHARLFGSFTTFLPFWLHGFSALTTSWRCKMGEDSNPSLAYQEHNGEATVTCTLLLPRTVVELNTYFGVIGWILLLTKGMERYSRSNIGGGWATWLLDQKPIQLMGLIKLVTSSTPLHLD